MAKKTTTKSTTKSTTRDITRGTVKNSKGDKLKAVTKSADPVAHVRAEPPRPLSPKEKSVLEFLEIYIRENGVSPTYQEICQHFGFASFNSVQRYLKQLEEKGYVQLPWANQKRAITLLRPASAFQDAVEGLKPDGDGNTSPHRLASRLNSKTKSNVTPAIMPTESLALPLLGRVAAGAPIEAMEHDEFIDVPSSLVRHADRTYALRVQGQSMIDDGILDGDVILVQRQSSASNGEIVVAMIGEEATVKRFYLHRGETAKAAARQLEFSDDNEQRPKGDRMIELRPANSSMTPMWYDPSEVQIRGVVVGLIRRFS